MCLAEGCVRLKGAAGACQPVALRQPSRTCSRKGQGAGMHINFASMPAPVLLHPPQYCPTPSTPPTHYPHPTHLQLPKDVPAESTTHPSHLSTHYPTRPTCSCCRMCHLRVCSCVTPPLSTCAGRAYSVLTAWHRPGCCFLLHGAGGDFLVT